jgi:hypothetical protein
MHSNDDEMPGSGEIPTENSDEEKVVSNQFDSLSNVSLRPRPGYLIRPVDLDVNLITV